MKERVVDRQTPSNNSNNYNNKNNNNNNTQNNNKELPGSCPFPTSQELLVLREQGGSLLVWMSLLLASLSIDPAFAGCPVGTKATLPERMIPRSVSMFLSGSCKPCCCCHVAGGIRS
jgi:hypothetical protein